MSKYDRKYDAFQLFEELLEQEDAKAPSFPEEIPSPPAVKTDGDSLLSEEGIYYEIEYDSGPLPGVGKFVQKPLKIDAPEAERIRGSFPWAENDASKKHNPREKDAVRKRFDRMRDIARDYRIMFYGSSKFYDQRVQQENSKIFYKQGMFMKDFEDEYERSVPYSSYFPYYQMMGYEQLRTYFTWRTQVRRGAVTSTSLSYAYLYIYELLNNIGVEDPQDGLDKLMFFWKEYRQFHNSIDKYVLRWLKDYHIYYETDRPFSEFIQQNGLTEYEQELSCSKDPFDLLCSLSKYKITKSAFYSPDREQLIKDCFSYTLDTLRQHFSEKGLEFDDFIFYPSKGTSAWIPFQGALFYPWLLQRDRTVILSEKEVYECNQNRWTSHTSLTNERGRQFLSYIFKQMESVLRRAAAYKYRITAGIHMIHPATLAILHAAGIHPEEIITKAVMDFYRKSTRTIVQVDFSVLDKIRQEALETQEKLIVPETETSIPIAPAPDNSPDPPDKQPLLSKGPSFTEKQSVWDEDPVSTAAFHTDLQEDTGDDPWTALWSALNDTERNTLSYLLSGQTDIKSYADAQGIMLEVLMDGINEKAMDLIGDSLVDEEFTIYEDYMDQVKGMVESYGRTNTYKNCQ